jgi:hypothetical protein
VGERAEGGAPDRAGDDREEQDPPPGADGERTEQDANQQTEPRAGAGADQRRPDARHPVVHLLDQPQVGADDPNAVDRELVVGEQVDGALCGGIVG